jgi:hypothetical protein
MTETPTIPDAANAGAGDAETSVMPAIPCRPSSDLMTEFILGLIAPLLMTAGIADMAQARLAVLETITAYKALGQGELVTVAQIVGFALASLDTLRLSTAPDLSLSMILRLRGNANALNRSAQQNNRVLDKQRQDNPPDQPSVPPQAAMPEQLGTAFPQADVTEADVQAAIENAQLMLKAAHTRIDATQASAQSTQRQADRTARPDPVVAEQRNNAGWAGAMITVAGELRANLANLPPALRQQEMSRATTLTRVARHLTGGSGLLPPAMHRTELMWGTSMASGGNQFGDAFFSLLQRADSPVQPDLLHHGQPRRK